MKTIGIIAEYNPFHNGHQYLFQEAKRLLGADCAIAVMSGNFVQRGAPAVMSKHARAKMALLSGIDVVLELPVVYATDCAENFALGAVSLLDALGCVDYLCFGSECGDLAPLSHWASLSANESPAYQENLRQHLKNGLSFPTAKAKALDADALSLNAQIPSLPKPYAPPSSSPNDILGIEYLKALTCLNSPMTPFTVKRHGSAYHDEQIKENSFCSASALRKVLLDPDMGEEAKISLIANHAPPAALDIYQENLNAPISIDDFSAVLNYKLLLGKKDGFSHYLDVSSDLSDKIIKNMVNFTDYSGFIFQLKSKDLTYARLSRALCHIMLDIYSDDTANDIATYDNAAYGIDTTYDKDTAYVKDIAKRKAPPYARLLGFRQEAKPLLAAIKKRSSIPLLSKMANARKLLNADECLVLEKDIQAAHIYEAVRSAKYSRPQLNEFRVPITVI